MDRSIYIAMAGAQQSLEREAVTAHNLANVGTAGYKGETSSFQAAYVQGQGMPTRAYALTASTGADLAAGTIQKTGRDLDVAIERDGFLAVQARDGSEAYTRDGALQLGSDGQLQTRNGLTVLGEGGPIVVPPDSNVSIARDGTISVTTDGQSAANVSVVGKLKLVNPAAADIAKSTDGLFRTKSGKPADADPQVSVVSGALEASNVNAVASMVDMINVARHFDLQMKLMQSVDANAQRATELLATNGG